MASNGGRLHLYGVVESGRRDSFGPAGLLQDEVWTIPHEDISLLVSGEVPEPLSELPKDRLLQIVARHQAVLEAALNLHNLVPIRFGISAADEAEVLEILRQGYSMFRTHLEAARGKVELDLVAKWDQSRVFEQVYQENAEIRRLQSGVQSLPPGEEKLIAQIRLGQAVASILRESRSKYVQRLLEAMEPVVLQIRRNALTDDLTICNLALLFEGEKQTEVKDKVAGIGRDWGDLVNLFCIGPLPLHSFHTLQIERIGLADARKASDFFGLSPAVSEDGVKTAFRAWARRFHPDVQSGKGEATPEFQEGLAAYRTLLSCHRGAASSGQLGREVDFFLVQTVELPGEEEVIAEAAPVTMPETLAPMAVVAKGGGNPVLSSAGQPDSPPQSPDAQ